MRLFRRAWVQGFSSVEICQDLDERYGAEGGKHHSISRLRRFNINAGTKCSASLMMIRSACLGVLMAMSHWGCIASACGSCICQPSRLFLQPSVPKFVAVRTAMQMTYICRHVGLPCALMQKGSNMQQASATQHASDIRYCHFSPSDAALAKLAPPVWCLLGLAQFPPNFQSHLWHGRSRSAAITCRIWVFWPEQRLCWSPHLRHAVVYSSLA